MNAFDLVCMPPNFLCCSEMSRNLYNPETDASDEPYRLFWDPDVPAGGAMWDYGDGPDHTIKECPFCYARIESSCHCAMCGNIEELKRSHIWDGERVCAKCFRKLFWSKAFHEMKIVGFQTTVGEYMEKRKEAMT